MFGNYQVISVITTKALPPVLWDCITQANTAQNVFVYIVLLLEFCKRHELSFLVYDVWQGLYASIIPLLIKNIFSTDSDIMIIPLDLIFDFVLCTCCVLGYTLLNRPPTLSKRLNDIVFQDCNWGSKIYLLYRNHACWFRHLLSFQSLSSVWFWVVSCSIQSWIEICSLDQQNQWERWEQKKWKLFLNELNFW